MVEISESCYNKCMPKYIDIIAPKSKQKNKNHKNNDSAKSRLAWFFVIILFCFVLILFVQIALQNNLFNLKIPLNLTLISNQFDDSQNTILPPPPNPSVLPSTQTSTNPTRVRIINASDDSLATEKFQKILTDNNFTIEQTGTVTNKFDRSIIYYKSGQKDAALKIKTLLNDPYQPYTDESQALSDTYDFLVIIGQKP